MKVNQNKWKDPAKQKEVIAGHMKEILLELGLDINHPEIKNTPVRVAKMFVDEIYSGLSDNNIPGVTVFPNEVKYNQMVTLKNIKVYSNCAHHMLPFPMNVSIGYIPNKKYVGISKLARIAKYFSRRPQTQEILTYQIADFIETNLKPKGVVVFIKGQHMCMQMRGIESTDATMITSEVRGLFKKKPELELKFLTMIKEGD